MLVHSALGLKISNMGDAVVVRLGRESRSDLARCCLGSCIESVIAALTSYWRVYSLHSRQRIPTGRADLDEAHPAGPPDELAYKSVVLPCAQFWKHLNPMSDAHQALAVFRHQHWHYQTR